MLMIESLRVDSETCQLKKIPAMLILISFLMITPSIVSAHSDYALSDSQFIILNNYGKKLSKYVMNRIDIQITIIGNM